MWIFLLGLGFLKWLTKVFILIEVFGGERWRVFGVWVVFIFGFLFF